MAGAPARVAVIVPCFDDGPLVCEAVSSVEESEPVEIVVVDDKSTDPTTLEQLERLRGKGVTVISHEVNSGVSRARMTGLERSSAPFVFPLDADDLAVAGRLSELADRLEADPATGVVFGDYEEFGTRTLVRAVPPELDPYRLAYTNEYPISALFRRSRLEEVGGFEPAGYDGRSYEDWNLWLTLAERGERGAHAGVGKIVYRRRLHGQRKLQRAKRRHRQLYGKLRAAHPQIFSSLHEHRQGSDLSLARKLLYPVVYGGRRRFSFEAGVKSLLDKARVWTLRR